MIEQVGFTFLALTSADLSNERRAGQMTGVGDLLLVLFAFSLST